MGYGWGGYANGKIPYSALVFVRGAWLEAKAAFWAEAMSIVFFSVFGKHLVYSEGFRDYERQEYLYDGWVRRLVGFFVASFPGGSIHGWALAIDVDLTDMTAEEIDWLHTVGRLFGWNWDTTGKPNGERWHLDFNLEPIYPFDPANFTEVPATPALPVEEDSNMITIKNTADGALFSLDNQSLTYHGQENEAVLTAAVNTVKDEIHDLSNDETTVMFRAYGIPEKYKKPGVMQSEGFGNNWSRQKEILAGQKQILDQLAKLAK